jgi:hypothetical protein
LISDCLGLNKLKEYTQMCIWMGKLTYWIQPSCYWTLGLEKNIVVFNNQDDHIVEFRIQTVYFPCKENISFS